MAQLPAEPAASRQRTFAYHLPWLGHVRRRGAGYEWVADPHATPDATP